MKLLFISTVCVIVLTHSADGQCHYQVTILPTLDCSPIGQDGGTPMAINDYGQVAGKHSHCLAEGESAFAWSGGPTIGTIPLPPGVTTAHAFDINNVLGSNGIGQVCGEGITPFFAQYLPMIWSNNQWQTLPFSTHSAIVLALNDFGLAVGTSNNANPNESVATIWIDGKPQLLVLPVGPRSGALAVNQQGTIVGWMGYFQPLEAHAFVHKDGQTIDLGFGPGGISANAVAVNSRNEVVVNVKVTDIPGSNPMGKVYFWKAGKWTEIAPLAGYNAPAGRSINSRGEVIGVTSNTTLPGNPQASWIWRSGTLSDLSSLLISGSGINPSVGGARSINSEGQIVAQASTGGTGTPLIGVTVVLTPVPDNAGDTDCNGIVNIDDLVNVITRWGPCPHSFCSADLNQNGVINVADLVTVLQNWDFLPPN